MNWWIITGVVEWLAGQWLIRTFELGTWPWSMAELLTQLGLVTLAACAFWAVRITLQKERALV